MDVDARNQLPQLPGARVAPLRRPSPEMDRPERKDVAVKERLEPGLDAAPQDPEGLIPAAELGGGHGGDGRGAQVREVSVVRQVGHGLSGLGREEELIPVPLETPLAALSGNVPAALRTKCAPPAR